jgi:hypothetical protein
VRGLSLLALLVAASVATAGDLDRHARFNAVHGSSEALTSPARVLRGGLTITGEKIQLDNGNFQATVQSVTSPYFQMSGLTAKGRMPINDALFQDAIATAINNILDGSTITMGSFKNVRDGEISGITLKDIHLVHANKALQGSLKASLVHPEFKAKSRYDKPSRSLVVTVESVKVAGIPVALSVAFFTMGQFMNYPFVKLDKPNVIIDLKPFLPGSGN